jgi:very-short-patch-repair endonuclease
MFCHHKIVTQGSYVDTFRKMRVRSAAEWRAEGLTEARLRSLVRSGDLVRVWHAVYATRSAVEWAKASPARSHALLVIAARAAVGRDSVASHQSAALIHGLDLFPAASNRVILTRPTTRRSGRRKLQDVFFHAAELPNEHVTTRLGAKVTTVPRTVVDLARHSTFMSAVVTADSALRSDCGITKARLIAVCDACAGWPGIRKARRAVDFADARAESVLESCARVIFHEHGLDPPELQFTITSPDFRYTVDFYWPRHRVIAEADGEVKYSEPRRAIRQLERDQQLRDHGEKLVHFTWRELFKTPQTVTGRIRKAFTSPTPF